MREYLALATPVSAGGTAKETEMEQLYLFNYKAPSRRRRIRYPQEYKVVSLRDCPSPKELVLCDQPRCVVDYWKLHIKSQPQFDPEREIIIAILLNTRRMIRGHFVVGLGTLDSVTVHPREVFRAAIVVAAHSVIVAHNHPSGDPSPSEADIRITRQLVSAGRILQIEVLDHIIVGATTHVSLRELGLIP